MPVIEIENAFQKEKWPAQGRFWKIEQMFPKHPPPLSRAKVLKGSQSLHYTKSLKQEVPSPKVRQTAQRQGVRFVQIYHAHIHKKLLTGGLQSAIMQSQGKGNQATTKQGLEPVNQKGR